MTKTKTWAVYFMSCTWICCRERNTSKQRSGEAYYNQSSNISSWVRKTSRQRSSAVCYTANTNWTARKERRRGCDQEQNTIRLFRIQLQGKISRHGSGVVSYKSSTKISCRVRNTSMLGSGAACYTPIPNSVARKNIEAGIRRSAIWVNL